MITKWSEQYSGNIGELDDQHKNLFSIMQKLYEAMKARKSKEILAEILEGMVDYSISHFSKEEYFFEHHNYPDKVAHKKEHLQFIEKCAVYKQDIIDEKKLLSMDMIVFLNRWWTSHIQKSDQSYSAFLNSKGVR